jgi:hypothetical protein
MLNNQRNKHRKMLPKIFGSNKNTSYLCKNNRESMAMELI